MQVRTEARAHRAEVEAAGRVEGLEFGSESEGARIAHREVPNEDLVRVAGKRCLRDLDRALAVVDFMKGRV